VQVVQKVLMQRQVDARRVSRLYQNNKTPSHTKLYSSFDFLLKIFPFLDKRTRSLSRVMPQDLQLEEQLRQAMATAAPASSWLRSWG
jgi:hypothetical protein